jgi:hypothetical protein
MKKIFLIICMLLLCLAVTSCGNGGNKYQKGWDRYCKDGAAMSGKTLQEYKALLEGDLTLSYVYLEETNTVYYKGYYGDTQREGSTFYFMYLVDEDYASESQAKLSYQYALDLYYDGYKGASGILISN